MQAARVYYNGKYNHSTTSNDNYHLGDIYETVFADHHMSFSEESSCSKHLFEHRIPSRRYIIISCVLWKLFIVLWVRIVYSLQHKYEWLTSISCYSSSMHNKDGMDELVVSRKNDPVEQSGDGKSVQFGTAVRKCTHMHITAGSRTQWLGYIEPAAQQGCNAETRCYCQKYAPSRYRHHCRVSSKWSEIAFADLSISWVCWQEERMVHCDLSHTVFIIGWICRMVFITGTGRWS